MCDTLLKNPELLKTQISNFVIFQNESFTKETEANLKWEGRREPGDKILSENVRPFFEKNGDFGDRK